MITWKLLFDGEEMKLLTAKELNLLREIFLMWEMSRVGLFPIPRVTHIGSGEGGTLHTWWVQEFFDILGKKGDAWHMILGGNPGIKGLSFI